MSSPLDGRIRAIAREEADATIGVRLETLKQLLSSGRVDELEKELAAARGRLDALEKAAGQTGQEERPAVRRPRKSTTPE